MFKRKDFSNSHIYIVNSLFKTFSTGPEVNPLQQKVDVSVNWDPTVLDFLVKT